MPHSRFNDLTFINADIRGDARSLRVEGSRIAAIGTRVQPAQHVIDTYGDRLLPGLINAHDHLQLNSLMHLQYPRPYRNAREWIADVNVRMIDDHALAASARISRDARLLTGGIKNLLSGVTTVAHHDPVYPLLTSAQFPTRVLTDFGWSHSLQIDGDDSVRASYERTPRDWPWIIHAAEGVDVEAAGELDRLEALGCLAPNTLIVHGVALDSGQRHRLGQAGAGLIWCPTSNLTLFETSADVAGLIAAGCVALGTDSRMTGARDFLAELRVARQLVSLSEDALESLATIDAARLLRLGGRRALEAGADADILILPAGMLLSEAERADVRLVMIGGQVLYADPDYAALLGPTSHWAEVQVDGRPKALDAALAATLATAGVMEDGLELPDVAGQAA